VSEVTFRLPSKGTQYGYVEVRATPEALGMESVADAFALGVVYASYVKAFQDGEREGKLNVTAPASEAVQAMTEDEAEALLLQLGATRVGEEPAPWEKPPTATAPKPWENKADSPAIANIDW